MHIQWRNILDGTDKNMGARFLRLLASFFSYPYATIVHTRNLLYDYNLLQKFRVDRPVISVGNLTLGGVGKTPFVAKIVEILQSNDVFSGVISRGYKAKAQTKLYQSSIIEKKFAQYQILNDEALELQVRLPNVPYFLGKDRVKVANALIEAQPELQAIILDDAFQHRRIVRDLNILVIDALDPFGREKIFPAGYLRESLLEARRADLIVLNRADLIDKTRLEEIKERFSQLAPDILWIEIAQSPDTIYQRYEDSNGIGIPYLFEKKPLFQKREMLKSARICAFCGLGAPEGFKKTLEREGLNVVSFNTLPDHCVYDARLISKIEQDGENNGADLYLTTLKDLVKIPKVTFNGRPLCALGIGVQFISGETIFRQKILEIVRS